MRSTRRAWPLLLVPAFACAPAAPVWSIRLVDGSAEGDLFSQATELELSVCERGRQPMCRVAATVDPSSGSASLPSRPPGEYRVEARLTGAVCGFGGSSWQTLASDDLETVVVLGPCNGFVVDVVELPDDLAGDGGLVGLTTTPLPDGRVFIAGGALLDGECQIAEVSNRTFFYDPNAGEGGVLDQGPEMGSARAFHTATLLKPDPVDGRQRVLFAGGLSVVGGRIQSIVTAEVFDPVAGGFRGAKAMATARYGHAAELLVSAGVLVVGGASTEPFPPPAPLALIAGSQTSLGSGEVFTPEGNTGTFDQVGNELRTARVWPTARRGSGNDIAILGGYDGTGAVREVDLYRPNERQFVPDCGEGELGDARWGHVSERLLDSERIFVAGGFGEDGAPLSSAEIYTVGVGSDSTGALTTARAFASIARVGLSAFVVCGGLDRDGASLATCDTWAQTADLAEGGMSDSRGYFAMAQMPSNVVMIAGGASMSAGGETCTGVRPIDLYIPGE